MKTDSSQRAAQHIGGQTKFQSSGITLTIARKEKSRNGVGWHFHEDPHLTFILRGKVVEGTRQEIYNCSAGTVLFHRPFEPHYNTEREANTEYLHIDFARSYFEELARKNSRLPGIVNVRDSVIKFLCYKIFREAAIADDVTETSIHSLSLAVLGQLLFTEDRARRAKPLWVDKLEEILRTGFAEKFTLGDLSHELRIHPVHLSRSFPQYFHCTLGEFVRSIRVERSLAFIPDKKRSLTEIGSDCGFADQSHFLRSFKRIMGVSPSAYRKLLCH